MRRFCRLCQRETSVFVGLNQRRYRDRKGHYADWPVCDRQGVKARAFCSPRQLSLGLAHRIHYRILLYDVYAVLKKSSYLPYKLVLNGYTIYTIFARAGAVNGARSMSISVSPGLAPAPYAPHATAPIRPPGYYP
jgi:hypothetical protein